MIIAGAILFRVGARREKPIAWTTLAPLWTEALQTAPITTGEILCALWGAACRRSRVIGMAILAAGVFGGSVAFTVSESPIFVILQWGAALYAGFVSVVWLSPYPAMAQCRAITRIAQPGVRGVGMRVLSVIVLVVVIYAVLAIAIMGMMRIFELVNSGRIDLTPLTRALQFCASLDPWIRVVIAAGMAVAANRLVTWHYQKRFPRHWAAAMENLRKYMRSDSPKFISMTR